MITKDFYKDGDIVLLDHKGIISNWIKLFQREPSGDARISHVELLVFMSQQRMRFLECIGHKVPDEWLSTICAVGAVAGGVKIRQFDESVTADTNHWWVVRNKGMSSHDRNILARIALQFVDTPYSLLRLALFAVDRLLGTQFTVKLSPGNVVCSYLVAFAYCALGVFFDGSVPGNTTPDDIWDTVMQGSHWTIVAETMKPRRID